MKTAGTIYFGHQFDNWHTAIDTEFFVVKLDAIGQAFRDLIEGDLVEPRDTPTEIIVTPTEIRLCLGFFSYPRTTEKPFEVVWSHKEFALANCWSRKERDDFVSNLERLITRAKNFKYEAFDEPKEDDEIII